MSPRGATAGLVAILTAGFLTFTPAGEALATPVIASDPGSGWDITARARNGRTGFELALQDPAVANLNAPGAPAWSWGNPHHFELSYSSATGQVTFSMDFTRDSSFGANETLSYTFSDYAGNGFRYANLYLQGNTTGNAKVGNLTINGTGFGDFGFTSNSVVQQSFTDTSGYFSDLLITGDLIFSGNGNTDERPRMWLRFGDAVSVLTPPDNNASVPEPATLAVLGLGLAGIAAARRRRA